MALRRPFDPRRPYYVVHEVHRLAAARSGVISIRASDPAARVGGLNEDIWLVLEILDPADFHCAAMAGNHKDRVVDVYYLFLGQHSVYLEVAIVPDADEGDFLVVSCARER